MLAAVPNRNPAGLKQDQEKFRTNSVHGSLPYVIVQNFQRASFSEEPVVKKKRTGSEPEDDFEDSEDEMMDTEQLEKFALAQL